MILFQSCTFPSFSSVCVCMFKCGVHIPGMCRACAIFCVHNMYALPDPSALIALKSKPGISCLKSTCTENISMHTCMYTHGYHAYAHTYLHVYTWLPFLRLLYTIHKRNICTCTYINACICMLTTCPKASRSSSVGPAFACSETMGSLCMYVCEFQYVYVSMRGAASACSERQWVVYICIWVSMCVCMYAWSCSRLF